MSLVIAASAATDLRYGRRTGDTPRAATAQPSTPVNALVPLRERRRGLVTGTRARPQAAFVAHLIACHADAPMFRERRRDTPETAAVAYDRPLDILPVIDRTV